MSSLPHFSTFLNPYVGERCGKWEWGNGMELVEEMDLTETVSRVNNGAMRGFKGQTRYAVHS
jgi:hypothetical protein